MGGALLTGVHARPNVWVVGQIDENSLKVLYQHPFGHSICEAE